MQRLQRSIMRRKKGRQRSRRRMQSLQGCVKKRWNGRQGSKMRRTIRLLICTKSCMNKMIERPSAHVVVGHAVYNAAQDSRLEGGHGAGGQNDRITESPIGGRSRITPIAGFGGQSIVKRSKSRKSIAGFGGQSIVKRSKSRKNKKRVKRGRNKKRRFCSETLLRQSVQSKAQKLMTQAVTTETLLVVKQWWPCMPNQLLCSRKPWR